jgi:phosphotriesterase-related protein
MVNTVTGPVAPEQLGPTLMHEHLRIVDGNMARNYPQIVGDERAFRRGRIALEGLYARGIRTIIDPSTVDLGRDVELMRAVSGATDVQIIAATGSHRNPPRYFRECSVDFLTGCYVREVVLGVGDTGIKAGIVKLASEETEWLPELKRCFQAGARAHRRTGVPIITHSGAWTRSGLTQQDLFVEEGVDLARVIIGHSGDSTDTDYLKQIMDRGSLVGMDRFGLVNMLGFMLPTVEERTSTVVELCKAGYADRVVLSHDSIISPDSTPGLQLMTATHEDWNVWFIPDKLLPLLRQRGVTDEQIDLMMVQNIRRLFEQDQPY